MYYHHVLDLPEITTLLIAYLSPQDVLSCLRVCKHWRRVFEQELWRRTIFNPLPDLTIERSPSEDHKQSSLAFIASKLLPCTSQLPSCRYCLPQAPNGSTHRRFFGRQDHAHLHDHSNGHEITRRLDRDIVQAKGYLIQSLVGLDARATPLLTAVAVHCVHLRHLELVDTRFKPPAQLAETSLKERIWPTPPWTVQEASSAVEAFMKTMARVGEHGELIENTQDNERFLMAPTRGYGMNLESVCVVFEDSDSDFRLLWSLRHLPNLRRLEIQGPGQWINWIVNDKPDKMVFWLEDLVVLLERCVRIEEVVMSSLQLVSSATEAVDEYCRDIRARRNKHFETLLEAPLDSPTTTAPRSSSSSSRPRRISSSFKSLALPILPHHIDVYLSLFLTIGPTLQDLDLSLIKWKCHLAESTTHMLSLLSACPVLRTLTIRFKPDPARKNTVLRDLYELTSTRHPPTEEEIRRMVHERHPRWSHTLVQHGHGLPGAYSCLDFAKLATVFPRTLTALTLVDVQIEYTSLLSVDPDMVQGIRNLRVLYQRHVCPIEVLEQVLSVWRGLVTVEIGAAGLKNRDNSDNTSSDANYWNTGAKQQGDTVLLRDRHLVEAARESRWACRYTLRHLDLCQIDVYLYPGYCELLMGRIQELEGLRDLRVDLRCFRVGQSKVKKKVGGMGGGMTTSATETGTGTGTGINSVAGGQATGDVEEVDLYLRPKFEWRQLDRLFVHGARHFSGDGGVATVGWFEPLRLDEMLWIRGE
ncbi:hypothetical protein BGZ81_011082 [Podila clonocystis]|nr:hypothetical protein BGZ81_011082 [Podila clonocystis]